MSRAAYASAAGMPSAAGSTAPALDASCSVTSRARMAVRAWRSSSSSCSLRPRISSSTKGSSSSRRAVWWQSAAVWEQWSHAPQSHSASRSPMPGSSSMPAAAASSTRCGGMSWSSSAAMCPARSATRSRKRSQSSSLNSWSSTSQRHGVPSRSLTTAVIRPGRTETAPTAPARACRRPCLTCRPSNALSASACSQARPHQVRAKPRPCAGGRAAKVRSLPAPGRRVSPEGSGRASRPSSYRFLIARSPLVPPGPPARRR